MSHKELRGDGEYTSLYMVVVSMNVSVSGKSPLFILLNKLFKCCPGAS